MAGASDESASTPNRLIAALPPETRNRLLARLVRVPLPHRHVLQTAEQPIEAVYFIESGMLSLVATFEDGVQAEVGVIGREGLLGVSLLSGVATAFTDTIIQMPGTALRLPAGAFQQEVAADAGLRGLLFRYGEAQHAQISQTAACNGRHGLEQRLARWLLMAHDRADSDDLPLTQEYLSVMLGVHRPSISVVAGTLQRAGLIRYGAGHIQVLDRPGLQAASCECHGVVRRRFALLLGD